MPLSEFASELSEMPASTSMATRDVLLGLGFTPCRADFTDEQPGYQYNFGNLLLKACQLTNLYMRPVMQFSGFMATPFKMETFDFEMPLQVESFQQGAAYVSYNLGKKFIPKRPTTWLEEARQWEDLLPWRRRMILYEARPHCFAEAEWFRVAVKKLLAWGQLANDEQTFEVICANEVLKFKMQDQTVAIQVRGKDWPTAFVCKTKQLAKISKRTPSVGVPVGVWEGRLTIGRIPLELDGETSSGGTSEILAN
jgi:hypothetical protein